MQGIARTVHGVLSIPRSGEIMSEPAGKGVGVFCMERKSTRDHIIEEADLLFYQQGFEHTSFAMIAEAVNISRGNFYYHFKTKDELLNAVINHRLTSTQAMLDKWEAEGENPAHRILSFVDILIMNQTKIKHYGCPFGTLCAELAKLNHVSQSGANKLFTLFRAWLRRQFEHLGYTADADELAMHLLARCQGIAAIASAFRDEKIIRREVDHLYRWLSMTTKKMVPVK